MPFVVVWMVTYNHESYIRQAIESVMMQQTDFEYKLFIGEDCSTDDTRGICIELKKRYPGKIELFLNEENIGATANGIQMYKNCMKSDAKYIALLEGDDYWTDPLKLQKQVDILESNNEYVMCFGKVKIEDELENRQKEYEEYYIKPKNREYIFSDFVAGHCIPTLALVFKTSRLYFPDWFATTLCSDIILEMMILDKYKAVFIDEDFGVYRVNTGGISKDEERIKDWLKKHVHDLRRLDVYLGKRHTKTIRQIIVKLSVNEFKVGVYKFISKKPVLFKLYKSIKKSKTK